MSLSDERPLSDALAAREWEHLKQEAAKQAASWDDGFKLGFLIGLSAVLLIRLAWSRQ